MLDKYSNQIFHADALAWIAEQITILQPDSVYLCTGSQAEYSQLCQELVQKGTLIPLSQNSLPGCYLARSAPSDVARVEKQTFICSEHKNDAGPTNNWMAPREMRAKLLPLLSGAMRGRTMYIIPYCMGPLESPFSKLGIELSDSAYVVLNMKIMTRMGNEALKELNNSANGCFVKGIHTVGAPLEDGDKDSTWPCNETKYIAHFPESQTIISYGSGYGGNALLGKKCFALRIASVLGRDEGWLAEHMLILAITNPAGQKKYIAAAFPSACGKTNLAMLRSTLPGWKVETVGDDIAWIRPGKDGRLWAINPENGFFGVAPGTSYSNNPTAMDTIQSNTLFTNVALTEDLNVWWEGKSKQPPGSLIDWKGNYWNPQISNQQPAAHPNSRFTAPLSQCPTADPAWENAEGVPLSAILFGGRRKRNIPLVVEAFDWAHGVTLGACISSEQTAAAEGVIGTLRHDPFAMLPFCGYNMADYFAHWLSMPKRAHKLPKIYQVNWFLQNSDGEYLWPGFGENIRVLKWIFERDEGKVSALETPLGKIPHWNDFEIPEGLSQQQFNLLFECDKSSWKTELADIQSYMAMFGDRLPSGIREQITLLEQRLTL